MNRTEDNLFPIAWGDSEFVSIIETSYTDVIFLEDFGVFKKGDEVLYLLADIEKGLLYEVDEDGEIIEEQAFKCVPYN